MGALDRSCSRLIVKTFGSYIMGPSVACIWLSERQVQCKPPLSRLHRRHCTSDSPMKPSSPGIMLRSNPENGVPSALRDPVLSYFSREDADDPHLSVWLHSQSWASPKS